jgi:outer membrane protein TolC
MKHSKYIARTLLTSFYVLATISCSKNQLDGKQLREANTKKDTQILYSRVNLPDKPLKLKDIINVAFKRNLNLLAYEQEYLMEKETAIRSQLAKLPQANVNGEMQHRFNRVGSLSGGGGLTSSSFSSSTPRNTRKADVQYLFSLLDFGVTHYRFKQAKNRFNILAQQHKRLKQNLLMDLTTAYWQAVIAQKATEGAEIILALTEKRQKDIQKQMKHKLVSEISGLENQRRLLETQLRLKSYKKELEDSKSQLLQLMGLPPSTEFDLAYEDVKLRKPEDIDVKKLEELSLMYRPELFTADLEEKIDADEVRASILSMFPNVSILGGHFFDHSPFLENNYWNTVGSKALWNILSLPTNEKSVTIAKHKKKMSEASRLNTSVGVISQVHLAHLEFKDSWEQYKLAESLFSTKERLLEVGRLEQRQGVFDSADILELESEALFSEIFATTTFAELNMSLSRMGNAIGDPLAFVEINLDVLELSYVDMVNFDVEKRQAEQWAYAKSTSSLEEEYEDPLIEIAISEEEQTRREQLLASAQNREYFESTLPALTPEQLRHTISYTTLFTTDEKARERVGKLSLEQVIGLKKESRTAFNDVVASLGASQIKDLITEDPTVFGVTDISKLQAHQLVDLYRVDSTMLDHIMPQITPVQLAALMRNDNFINIPGAKNKVRKLSQDQLELVYSVDATLFRKVVGLLSGEQVVSLIGRESQTRGIVTKWSQNNLPGVIDSDVTLINLLEAKQLEFLAANASEKFDLIDHQLSVDQIRSLIRETSVLDTGSNTSKIIAKVPEYVMLEVFSKDAVAFEKVIPLLSAAQLDFFIQKRNVFNENDRAGDRTSKLGVDQIVQLKKLYAESFQDITQNFSGRQLLEIFAKGDSNKRGEMVKVLSNKQVLEIHQTDPSLFMNILGFFDKDQLVDLIYNSPAFINDPQAPQHIQSLTNYQLESLKDASHIVFAALIPHMTEFQILDLIKSDEMVMSRSVSPTEDINLRPELLAHSMSPSQLQALFYLDQDSFRDTIIALNAFQLDSLLHLNPKIFSEENIVLISVDRLLELNEINPSNLSFIINKASAKQVGSIIASSELSEQNWLEKVTPDQISQIADNELILTRAVSHLSGKQLSAILEENAVSDWFTYTKGETPIVNVLTAKQLEEINAQSSSKLNSLMKELNRDQLVALVNETTVFEGLEKNRLKEVSFQKIFEVYHSNPQTFTKVIPQLGLEQIRSLFADEAYIDNYISLFSAEQIHALMERYPEEVKKVVDRLKADQISALVTEEGLTLTQEFVSALSMDKIEDISQGSTQTFIAVSKFLDIEKIISLVEREKVFIDENKPLSLAQNVSVDVVMELSQKNLQLFDRFLPHLSGKQLLTMVSKGSQIFGALNPDDIDSDSVRITALTIGQVYEIHQQSVKEFYRLVPFLSAGQIQGLSQKESSLFRVEQLARILKQRQLLELARLDVNVLTGFSDLLTVNQVLNTLVHSGQNANDNWITGLTHQQIEGVYQRDQKTFKRVLPLFSVNQLDKLLIASEDDNTWFGKKGKKTQTGILDGNESLIQMLSAKQIDELDVLAPNKVDGLISFLSVEQTQGLLDSTNVMTKNDGQRAKKITTRDLLRIYSEKPKLFDRVFTFLSLDRIKELFDAKAEVKSYINKMNYQQLSAFHSTYPSDFLASTPNMDIDQMILLMETQELKPETEWVANLSLEQLGTLAKKEKLAVLMPTLTAYQFEDLVLNTSLLTKDKEALIRVQRLNAAQIIQLNQKNPGAVDLVLTHLSLNQIQQLAAKDPDFLSENRVKSLSAKQLEVINTQDLSDSREYLSKLTNDQLVALITRDQFFTVSKEENRERIRALSPGHLSHVSKLQAQFLEKAIRDLDFEQLKHLILTTSFLTHDKSALQRMSSLGTEQIIDLYRKLNFFKEGKRALALLHQLNKTQLVDIAEKDISTFNALFSSFSLDQIVDLLNDPKKPVTLKHVQTLDLSTLVDLSKTKTVAISYPQKTYFDVLMKFLSGSQVVDLFENTTLMQESFDGKPRLQYLDISQIESAFERNPDTFKKMIEVLSSKQISALIEKTPIFTNSDDAKEMVEKLSDEQLKELDDKSKELMTLVIRNLNLSQLDAIYQFSQSKAKAGSWTSFLSLQQVESIGRVAPQFITQILPHLTSGQILQLMESTSLFQNPTYSKRYVQNMTIKQVKEISQSSESYFNQIIGQLSNNQISKLMDVEEKQRSSRSGGLFSQLFKKKNKTNTQSSEGIISSLPSRIQYLTVSQLDYIYKNEESKFWEVVPQLNAYQLSQVVSQSALFKQQRTASELANVLDQDQLEELLSDKPEDFKSLIVYLNGSQLQKLVSSAKLFSSQAPTKDLVNQLMLSQVEDLSRVSTKSFASLLRYLSISQLADLIDKTTLLTAGDNAPFYLQYLTSHQVLKLRDQQSNSFSKLVRVMDTRQIVSLLDMKNTPLTSQYLQQLTLSQLDSLSVGQRKSFMLVLNQLTPQQLNDMFVTSSVFKSLKDKESLGLTLHSSQLTQLGESYPKAFEVIVPYISGAQVSTLINVTQDAKKSFIGKVLDQVSERKMRGVVGAELKYIQALSIKQLRELNDINNEKFDSIASGLNSKQISSLIESSVAFEGKEGMQRLSVLYPEQLVELANSHPQSMEKLIARMTAKQIDSLSKGNNLLTSHSQAPRFVNVLTVKELRELSNNYSSTFDLILANIGEDVVTRLIKDSGTDFTPHFVMSLSFDQLKIMHGHNSQNFKKAFSYFNIIQIANFIERSDLLTADKDAKAKVSLLTLGQLQELNAINSKLFDAIIANLTSKQLEGIVRSNSRLMTQERIKKLTEKQLSELTILPNEFKRLSGQKADS